MSAVKLEACTSCQQWVFAGPALMPWLLPETTPENLSFRNVFVAKGPVWETYSRDWNQAATQSNFKSRIA